eukprot:12539693-Heterocapsa_arctica.AAC.1
MSQASAASFRPSPGARSPTRRLSIVVIRLSILAHNLWKTMSVSSGIQWRWREVSPIPLYP